MLFFGVFVLCRVFVCPFVCLVHLTADWPSFVLLVSFVCLFSFVGFSFFVCVSLPLFGASFSLVAFAPDAPFSPLCLLVGLVRLLSSPNVSGGVLIIAWLFLLHSANRILEAYCSLDFLHQFGLHDRPWNSLALAVDTRGQCILGPSGTVLTILVRGDVLIRPLPEWTGLEYSDFL